MRKNKANKVKGEGEMVIVEKLVVETKTDDEDTKFVDELEELCKKYAGKKYCFKWKGE